MHLNYILGAMTIPEQILDYASTQCQPFRRRNLMQFLDTQKVSVASANVLLNRLVKNGKLVKTGYGLYAAPIKEKQNFVYNPSEEERTLAEQIKKKFPFAAFCVWSPTALARFMQHVPALKMVFVDVERVAMESVFIFLQGVFPTMPILLNPTAQECERYITTEKILIVRALVTEAPITLASDTPVPTLEKILVDVAGDRELNFAQGAELYTIYSDAFSSYNVNRKRLLRYAARRNRRDYILKIFSTIGL